MPLNLPPQPEPDVAAPPPGIQAKRSWGIAVVVLLLGTIPVVYLVQQVRERRREARTNQMWSSMRSLSMALFEFDSEYGSFPSDETQADVCDSVGLAQWPSVMSNDLLRQLVATGLKSETIFYDGGVAGWTRKPDNVISPIHKALEPGECAFAYVPGTTATGHPSRPVLLYPVVPGSLRFDPKPLGGKAIALRLDGSMAAIDVDRHGRGTIGGKDYFDPSQPMWGGRPPDVRAPAR